MSKAESIKIRLSEKQLSMIASVLSETISKAARITIPPSDLVSYIGQNGIVIIPSREELERIRRKKSISLSIEVNPEPVL
jgi:hypothetical protein